jgi:hypothetical protein
LADATVGVTAQGATPSATGGLPPVALGHYALAQEPGGRADISDAVAIGA